MGKSAAEIVSVFMSEMNLKLSRNEQKNLLKFAEAIILMDDDAKKLIPSLRNCQYYSETKVAKEFRVSHGTFQNDKYLHMMVDWHLEKKKAGLKTDDKSAHVKELENSQQKLRKQLQGLLAKQNKYDSLCIECEEAKINKVKQEIRFKRAMNVLRQHGLDGLVELYISPEDLSSYMYGLNTNMITGGAPDQVLVQDLDDKTNVQ